MNSKNIIGDMEERVLRSSGQENPQVVEAAEAERAASDPPPSDDEEAEDEEFVEASAEQATDTPLTGDGDQFDFMERRMKEMVAEMKRELAASMEAKLRTRVSGGNNRMGQVKEKQVVYMRDDPEHPSLSREFQLQHFPLLESLDPQEVSQFLIQYEQYEETLKTAFNLEQGTLYRSIPPPILSELGMIGVNIKDRAEILKHLDMVRDQDRNAREAVILRKAEKLLKWNNVGNIPGSMRAYLVEAQKLLAGAELDKYSDKTFCKYVLKHLPRVFLKDGNAKKTQEKYGWTTFPILKQALIDKAQVLSEFDLDQIEGLEILGGLPKKIGNPVYGRSQYGERKVKVEGRPNNNRPPYRNNGGNVPNRGQNGGGNFQNRPPNRRGDNIAQRRIEAPQRQYTSPQRNDAAPHKGEKRQPKPQTLELPQKKVAEKSVEPKKAPTQTTTARQTSKERYQTWLGNTRGSPNQFAQAVEESGGIPAPADARRVEQSYSIEDVIRDTANAVYEVN